LPKEPQKSPVQSIGIPHLAKNERDVGHPSFVAYGLRMTH
jgi:hypothetical protein